MKFKAVWVMLIVLGVFLAGCASNAPTTLLEYQRTGGIAGLDDRLVIDSAGKATLTRKGEATSFTLNADVIKALTDELEAVNFSQLDAEYLPGQAGADLFDYRLTYGGHTVHAVDTAVPEGMLPVLELLNQLIEANS